MDQLNALLDEDDYISIDLIRCLYYDKIDEIKSALTPRNLNRISSLNLYNIRGNILHRLGIEGVSNVHCVTIDGISVSCFDYIFTKLKKIKSDCGMSSDEFEYYVLMNCFL